MTQTGGIYNQTETLIPKILEQESMSSERALLAEILQKYEGDPWLRITNVELSGVCAIGDNNMSTVQRAYVEGVKSSDKPFHKCFIMKRQMNNTEMRLLLKGDQVWANEEHMYITVIPRLRRHCTTDLPYPKLYYSDKDLMVLEDLKEKGYSMVDKFLGLDLEHSLLFMKTLALFHSSSLAMKILDDEMFNIMKENLKHPYNGQAGKDLSKIFIKQTLGHAVKTLETNDVENKELISVLQRVREKFDQYIEFLNKNSCNSDLSVVIHGDMWINNMLFSYEGNPRKPKTCKFVDFQGTRIGSLALDIVQSMYTSIQPEIRKQHYKTLIRMYYDSLISYLKTFVGPEKRDCIERLPFEKFEKELDTFRIYGLLNAIMLLPVITNEIQAGNCVNDNSLLNITRPYKQSYKGRLIDVLEEYKNNHWV